MSKRHVYKGIERFNEGMTNTHDDERSSRPSDALNDDSICTVRVLIHEDQRFTVSDIHRQMAKCNRDR